MNNRGIVHRNLTALKNGQDELFDKIQGIYFKYMPNPTGLTAPKPFKRYTEEDAQRHSHIARKYGFSIIETKVY